MFSFATISDDSVMPPPKPPDKRRGADGETGFQTVPIKRRKNPGLKKVSKNYDSDTSMDTNYYASLYGDEDADNVSMTSGLVGKSDRARNKSVVDSKKPKEPKLPPITLTDISMNQVCKEMTRLQIQEGDFQFTINQAGIKLFIKSSDKYNLIKNHFAEANIKFYTHSLKENQKIKIVLYGLPDIDLNEVKKMLAVENLNPTDIKKMTIKYKKFNGHCNYLLYFDKSSNVKISDVRQIRALNYCIVKWQFYSKHSVGPTQCSNCQRFGHGANNCYLSPKCLKCSEDHKTNECVHNFIGPPISATDLKRKIPQEKVKCSNCHKAHTANYKGCEERILYQKRLEVMRNRNRKIQNNQNPTNSFLFKDSPDLYNANFPSINNNRSLNSPAWNTHKQNPYTIYSKAFESSTSVHQNNDLFSPMQCMTIFNEFLEKLNNCKNKKNQLQVIAEITFKYMSK